MRYANDYLKEDKQFMLSAATQNGLALRYADYDFREDREIVLAAKTYWASHSNNFRVFETQDPSLGKLLQSFSDYISISEDLLNSYRFRIPNYSCLASCLQQLKVKSFIEDAEEKFKLFCEEISSIQKQDQLCEEISSTPKQDQLCE